ncbi:uncharacterized protein LOC144438937 [Glandiceps talaboti]
MALLALLGLGVGAVIGGSAMAVKSNREEREREEERDREERTRLEREQRKREEREREMEVKHVTEEVWDEGEIQTAVEQKLSELEASEKQREREHQQELLKLIVTEFLNTRLPSLKKYKIGDMIGYDEFKYNGLEIGFENVRIALFGPTGSGKSSFINMAQQVMEDRDLRKVSSITQGTGREGTMSLVAYLQSDDFQFYLLDTRGFFDTGTEMMTEMKDVLSGRIDEDDTIYRKTDLDLLDRDIAEDAAFEMEERANRPDAELAERVHGLICILDYDDARFNDYKDEMKPYREFFKSQGISPVSVVMFKTEQSESEKDAKSEEDKIMKALDAASTVGASKDRTFILENRIVDDNIVINDYSKTTITKILETVLIGAESYIKLQLLEEKYRQENLDEDKPVEPFLNEWQKKYLWTDDEMSALRSIFSKENVTTVETLKNRWGKVKSEIPKPLWGMTDIIEHELPRI